MRLLIGTAFAAAAADVLSKLLAARFLVSVELGWLVHLRLTRNTGMALGLLAGNAAAGILLPLCVIACGIWLMRRYRMTRFKAVACGLMLGGFAGNFAERLLHSYVLDMIYFPWMPWFVCNVADICICFGVALLAFSLLLRPQDWEELSTAEEDTKDAND